MISSRVTQVQHRRNSRGSHGATVKRFFFLSQNERACNSDRQQDQTPHLITTEGPKTTVDVWASCWSVGKMLMCYVNTPSPRAVPFGTCPLDINRHRKTQLSVVTQNCGLCTSGLNDPLPLSQIVQTQLLGDFSRHHCIGQVLLVGRKPALPHRASRSRSTFY